MSKWLWVIGFIVILSSCQPDAGMAGLAASQEVIAGGQAMAAPTGTVLSYRILALGDSYTIGESVPVEGRWPVQLAAALRSKGIQVAEPEIIARTGWTTSELLAAMDRQNPEGPYQLVTLLIGVNNQFRGYPVEDYRRDLLVLFERAVQLAGNDPEHVLVVTTPDWGVMPFAEGRDRQKIAREIDLFNAVLTEEAGLAGIPIVDVTLISRQAITRREYIAVDGLHPSAAQYTEWVKVILPAAQQALEIP